MAEYFKDGKVDGKAIKDIVGMTEQDILALLQLGNTYYTQGRIDSALQMLEGVAAADPDNKYVYSMLGAVYTKRGDIQSALDALNKAETINPNDITLYVNRGEVRLKLGKAEDAAKDFKKAMDMDPDRKSPAANRARLILTGLAYVAKKVQESQQ